MVGQDVCAYVCVKSNTPGWDHTHFPTAVHNHLNTEAAGADRKHYAKPLHCVFACTHIPMRAEEAFNNWCDGIQLQWR